MKKNYIAPEMAAVLFDTEDIITASGDLTAAQVARAGLMANAVYDEYSDQIVGDVLMFE